MRRHRLQASPGEVGNQSLELVFPVLKRGSFLGSPLPEDPRASQSGKAAPSIAFKAPKLKRQYV